jgi:large subunit ribosomal protein L30
MKIAVILIRGTIGLPNRVKDTLTMLNLYRKNYCTFLEDTPSIRGMLNKVKDYVTWGSVTEETIKLLFEKRGEEYTERETDSQGKINYKRKWFEFNGKKIKKYFRLSPPRGGFEKNGIKKTFIQGGALGHRKDKMNDLIKKMV